MKRKTLKNIRKATSFAVIFAIFCGIMSSPNVNYHIEASSSEKAQYEELIKKLNDRNAQIDSEMSSIDGSIAENEYLQDLAYEKLNTTKDTIDYYNNLIYYQNIYIEKKQEDIDDLSDKIADKEKEIDGKRADIEALQAENAENLERFGDIMYAMYVTDGIDVFSVLSEANDFYDLLVRAKLVMNITEQNTRFMNNLKQSINDLEDMIVQLEDDVAKLESDKTKLESDKTDLETELSDLEQNRSESEALSQQYNTEYYNYSAAISDFEARQEALSQEKKANAAEVEAYEQEIQRIIREAQMGSNQTYVEGEWMWPVERNFHYITTYFGYDSWRGGNHSGIDIGDGGINGTNVYASKAGTVIKTKTDYIPGYSYGMYVVIDHGDGYSTLYGHLSAIYVYEGQQLNQGDVVGAVGSTGWSTGPHLHFEVRINGTAQDPFGYVNMP